jgi:hypothetical protein
MAVLSGRPSQTLATHSLLSRALAHLTHPELTERERRRAGRDRPWHRRRVSGVSAGSMRTLSHAGRTGRPARRLCQGDPRLFVRSARFRPGTGERPRTPRVSVVLQIRVVIAPHGPRCIDCHAPSVSLRHSRCRDNTHHGPNEAPDASRRHAARPRVDSTGRRARRASLLPWAGVWSCIENKGGGRSPSTCRGVADSTLNNEGTIRVSGSDRTGHGHQGAHACASATHGFHCHRQDARDGVL